MSLSYCTCTTDTQGRELAEHGSALFPIACYEENIPENAAPFEAVPWHWHEEWEAILVKKGTAIVSAEFEKYTLKEGQGIFINSGVLHEVHMEKGLCCHTRSIVFHPRLVGGTIDSILWQKYLQPLLQNTLLKSICLDGLSPWHKDALRAIEDAWESVTAEFEGYEFFARNALSTLILLLKKHCTNSQSSLSEGRLRNTERIKIMLQFIHRHYAEELTTSLIAKSAMISESECLRCFHAAIGTTPIQYVRQFRIQKAAELLCLSQKKAGDIGAECGFEDSSYFTKIFREIKGCTPGEYRKQNAHAIQTK